MESPSVYSLVTQLCEKILKRQQESSIQDVPLKQSLTVIRKLRSKSFSILLNKSPVFGNGSNMDPMALLIAHSLDMSMCHNRQQSKKLDECINKLFRDHLHQEPTVDAILRLLVGLVDTVRPQEVDRHINLFFHRMDQPKDSTNVIPYYMFDDDDFKPTKSMLSIASAIPKDVQYKLSYPFDKEPGTNLPLFSKFLSKSKCLKQRGPVAKQFIIPSFLKLDAPRGITLPVKDPYTDTQVDEGYGPSRDHSRERSPLRHEPSAPADATDVWELALSTKLPAYRTWESLGQLNPVREPPFLMESLPSVVRHFWNCHHLSVRELEVSDELPKLQEYSLQVVNRQDFMRHLKYLLIGIESASFQYQENGDQFVTIPEICVEGITPESIKAYTQDFLLCGTCFRRLESLVTPSPLQGLFFYNGSIFQALCENIRNYLHFYRGVVLMQSEEMHLQEIHQWLQGLKNQISSLARLCCLDSAMQASSQVLPRGVALVPYIYGELNKVTSPDIGNLFCSILWSSLQVYFRLLQKWIFDGIVQDGQDEFFIQMNPRMFMNRTREYWTNGFVMARSALPGFLEELEPAIVECGKTMNLLRLCCPENPLCVALESGHPQLRWCLKYSDLQQLKEECSMYEKRVRQLTGERVTIAWLFKCSEAQERAFQETIRQVHEKRLLKLKLAREEMLQQQVQRKQKQLAELREQIQLVQERRTEERERQLREDLEMCEQALQQEREVALQREAEKQKLVEYYKGLSAAADKRLHLAEIHLEQMHLDNRHMEMSSNEQEWRMLAELNHANTQHSVTTILECIDEVATFGDEKCAEVISVEGGGCKIFKEVTVTVENNLTNTQREVKNIPLNTDIENTTVAPNNNFSGILVNNDINQNTSLTSINVLGTKNDNDRARRFFAVSNDTVVDNAMLKPLVLYSDGLIQSAKYLLESSNETRVAAERIKAKVLGEEFGINIVNTTRANLSEASAASKNKWKMMHGDVDIITGVPKMIDASLKVSDEAEAVEEMSTSLSLQESKVTSSAATMPEEMSISVDDIKPEGNGLAGQKSALSSGGATPDPAGSSKASSSYNIASLTSSSSLDFCSRRMSSNMDTPMSVDGSVDAFKSSSMSTPSVPEQTVSFSSWKNSQMQTSASENVLHWKKTGKSGDTDDSPMVHVALKRSVEIPLRTQLHLANEAILKYFLVDHKFLSHLLSLRSYYFLLDGEFGRNLINSLFHKAASVQKPIQLFNYMTLNKILSEALGASLNGSEHNAELLSFSIGSIPEHFHMSSPKVFECLSLQYRVQWPLNIIITESALCKYNDIFSFLLKVRRVSWVLEEIFHQLKQVACRGGSTSSPQFHSVELWRHEMTLFVRAIQNYITSAVLQVCWVEFNQELQNANTLEDLYRMHVTYVKQVLFRCLLFKQSESVYSVLMKVFGMILKFHGQLCAAHWQISNAGSLEHPHFDILKKMYASYWSLSRFLYRFVLKLASVGYQSHLFELLNILNVNNFYEEKEKT